MGGVRPAYTFWPAQTPTWIDRLMGCCRSKIHDDVHSRLAFERKSSGVPTDALVGDFDNNHERQDLDDVGGCRSKINDDVRARGKIDDDVHSRLAFERASSGVPTDALVGNFEQDKERQDLNDVGQALLEHRYRHATQLNLFFNSCEQLSDVSAVGIALVSLTALQELTLDFNECQQLSDVSAVGTALASLTSLQELTLSFDYCEQLSDVSEVGTALAYLTSLQKLTLSFLYCSELSDVSTVGTALASLTSLQKLTLSFNHCSQLPKAIQTGFRSRDEFLKEIGTLQ